MSNIKTAVIGASYRDYQWYLREFNKDPNDYILIDRPEKIFGRYYNGYVMIGEEDNTLILSLTEKGYKLCKQHWSKEKLKRIEDLKEMIWYVESHRKMTCSEALNYLDEKGKVLCWLIEGSGIHGLPLRAVDYLTIERICELYSVAPEYFDKYGKERKSN